MARAAAEAFPGPKQEKPVKLECLPDIKKKGIKLVKKPK